MDSKRIDEVLNTCTLIVDTREHDTVELKQRIKDIGFPVKREKLDYGDYSVEVMIDDKPVRMVNRFAIERKMSIDELAGCFTKERERFANEFERARGNDAKLYLLVENGSFERINQGAYRSHMHPTAFMASVFTFLARYNCQILFCTPNTTGRLIKEIIIRELKEILREY